jgi:hypothetical protein
VDLEVIVMQKAGLFEQGRHKHVEVAGNSALLLWSLSEFHIAQVMSKEQVMWLKEVFGNTVEIDYPVSDGVFGHVWIVRLKGRLLIEKASIRSASPLAFRYSMSFVFSPDET